MLLPLRTLFLACCFGALHSLIQPLCSWLGQSKQTLSHHPITTIITIISYHHHYKEELSASVMPEKRKTLCYKTLWRCSDHLLSANLYLPLFCCCCSSSSLLHEIFEDCCRCLFAFFPSLQDSRTRYIEL